MDTATEDAIHQQFIACLAGTLSRFKTNTHRPFHAALLSPEAIFWSAIERSFSTSFGQRVVESISRLVVEAAGADEAHAQHRSQVDLTSTQWQEIDKILLLSRNAKARASANYVPEWAGDLDRLHAASGFGSLARETREVISDLAWRRGTVWHYASIKTVKPNLDQTAAAKKDLLALAANNSANRVYFGLPYNPFGELLEDYDWRVPSKIFDMRLGEPVLIGRDYWDALGGVGTYYSIVEIAQRAGEEFRPRLVDFAQSNLQIELPNVD